MSGITFSSDFDSLLKIGENTFGSKEKFDIWFNTPNFALGNKKPSEIATNYEGMDLILSTLHRINHGILC